MASPFAIFRRNQQTLLVVLFILAIFAFTLSDTLTSRTVNLPMLGLIIGTCLLTAIGVKMKQPAKYAAIGACGGLLIGFLSSLVLNPAGPETAAITSVGNISRIQEDNLLQNRYLANQFIQFAASKSLDTRTAGGQVSNYSFGITGREDREEAVLSFLLLEEARRLGIYIDKAAVSEYIDRVTDNQLSKTDYKEILSSIGITDGQLYSILQEQITIRTVQQQLAPRGFMTPEQYWEMFRKLNVTQKIQSVAVPVATLASGIPKPPENDLKAFFEEHKSSFPGDPQPESVGFKQPRKIQLAYIEASYLDLEATVDPITDEEIVAYYEEHKDPLYLNRRFPDDALGDPFRTGPGGGPDLFDPNLPVPEINLDQPKPKVIPDSESPIKDEKPGSSEPEKKEDAKGDSTPNPELPKIPEQEQKPDSSKPESSKPESQSLIEPTRPVLQQVAFLQEETDSKPNPETEKKQPAEKSEKPETESAESKDAKSESETAPADDKTIPPAPETSLDAPLKAPRPEPPKYKPLDDLLKDEIRDTLLRQRTNEKQQALATLVLDRMTQLSNEYFALETPEDKAKFIEDTQTELEKMAKEHGLNYDVTELMTASEMALSTEHPIGSATLGMELNNSNRETVTSRTFNLPPESVYEADAARSLSPDSIYVFWKTADRAAHVPAWEDKGIQEEVLEAWRIEQARPQAEARAKELADKLRDVKESWSDVLLEETITGEKDGVLLHPLISDSFSWLTTNSVPYVLGIQVQIPEPTDLRTVEKAGPKFMETVFENMQEGDVGVVPNDDLSIYYVVQIRDRRPAQREVFINTDLFPMSFDILQLEIPSPYSILVNHEGGELYRAWLDDLKRKYKVEIFKREGEKES